MKGILLLPIAFSLTGCGYISTTEYASTVYTPSSCCNMVVAPVRNCCQPVVKNTCCTSAVVVRRPVVTNSCCGQVQTTSYVTVVNDDPFDAAPIGYDIY
jgi:hypothetical protein